MKYFFLLYFIQLAVFADAQKKCIDCSCFQNRSMSWTVNVDDKGKEYLIRGDSLKINTYSIERLFAAMNGNFDVHIKLIKIKDSTVYIKILNTTYFTQQMGTAGSSWYLASIIFTLTENPECKKIYLDFIEGDHAGPPGYFTRENYEKVYTICN